MSRFRFSIIDVFVDQGYGGNQLAVLDAAEGLAQDDMQRIAREFNFAETTFVLRATAPAADARVRIFTPTREVPFAGHPNVGTACVLAELGVFGEFDATREVVFEEQAGLVPVCIEKQPDGSLAAELKAPAALSLGREAEPELMARVLSLDEDEIVTQKHLPVEASVGLPFLVVQLRDRKALERARINSVALNALDDEGLCADVHCYVHDSGSLDLRTRMFAPLDGVPEDPATGSANCALAGLLTSLADAADGDYAWTIAQGVEMGRPSRLLARSEKRDGEVSGIWVGGRTRLFARGELIWG